MKRGWRSGKKIAVQNVGMLDVQSILPIVDHPLFQLLRERKQLGLVYKVFPDATHTRFSHSLGVYALTQDRVRTWVAAEMITTQEGRDLEIFGLLHDWAHGPYSHLVEGVIGVNHDEIGAKNIHWFREAIEQCEASFEGVQELFNETDPLYKAVKAHPIGTDKLDYLRRDAGAAVVEGLGPIDRVGEYTYFFREYNGGSLAVDIKSRIAAMALQSFYVRMYAEVYCRKGCVIAERFHQRMIHELLSPFDGSAPEVSADDLWEMTDAELDASLRRSCSDLVQNDYRRFRSRDKLQVAVALRVRVDPERIAGKPIAIFEISPEESEAIGKQLACFDDVRALERQFDQFADLPTGSIMIVPVANPWRFAAHPLLLCDLRDPAQFFPMEEMEPDHYMELREIAKSIAAIRVCVAPEYRERVSSPKIAGEIRDRLMGLLSEEDT